MQLAVAAPRHGRVERDAPAARCSRAPAGSGASVSSRPSRLRWNSARTSWLPVAYTTDGRAAVGVHQARDRPLQSPVGVRVAGVGEVAGQHDGVQPAPVALRLRGARRRPWPATRRRRARRCTARPRTVRWVSDRCATTCVGTSTSAPSGVRQSSRRASLTDGLAGADPWPTPGSAPTRPAKSGARQVGSPRPRPKRSTSAVGQPASAAGARSAHRVATASTRSGAPIVATAARTRRGPARRRPSRRARRRRHHAPSSSVASSTSGTPVAVVGDHPHARRRRRGVEQLGQPRGGFDRPRRPGEVSRAAAPRLGRSSRRRDPLRTARISTTVEAVLGAVRGRTPAGQQIGPVLEDAAHPADQSASAVHRAAPPRSAARTPAPAGRCRTPCRRSRAAHRAGGCQARGKS